MCTSWTDQQWVENSRPADPSARYTLVDTRYDSNGEISRTYSETDGSWYGVLPGYGNHPNFFNNLGWSAHDQALGFLAANGYNLIENPLATPIPADHHVARSVAPDLVEQLA